MGHYGLLLSALLPEVPFEKEFSLAQHTTVGTGCAVNAFLPQTAGQLLSVVGLCERCNIRYFPLGAGSNVLPPDKEYGGVVLGTDHFNRLAGDGEYITAECGVSAGALLSFCRRHELSGLEFLAGIPGKTGGLTFMNAGTSDGRVGDVIESVTFLRGGKVQTYNREECCFFYKDSVFQRMQCVILSVRFRLYKSTREEVEKNIAAAAEKRKDLPKGKSMGCVFRNPAFDLSAGKLIEKSGCKGWKEGGATVSERHANFMINESSADSKDFYRLIDRVKRRVYERTGVLLKEEIRYIR